MANFAQNIVKVFCADKVFHFVSSEDYTMWELHEKVARLMSCNTYEICAVATNVDMELPIKSQDPSTPLSHIRWVRFRTERSKESKDVEMEDV
jgi:hypothetical protein